MQGSIFKKVQDKGFGFIQVVNGDEQIFFHYSDLKNGGNDFERIERGTAVRFDIVSGRKEGTKRAANIRRLDDHENSDMQLQDVKDTHALGMLNGRARVVTVEGSDGDNDVDPARSSGLYVEPTLHSNLYIHTPRTLAIEYAIQELEELINNKSVKEADIQSFFNKNPVLLHNNEFENVHSQIALTKPDGEKLIPDYILEPYGFENYCAFVELKLPKEKIYIKNPGRERLRASVCKHIAQLRDYSAFFDEVRNRERFYNSHKLKLYKPPLFLIIGRREQIDPKAARDIELRDRDIVIQTYDYIVDRGRILVKNLNKSIKSQLSTYN